MAAEPNLARGAGDGAMAARQERMKKDSGVDRGGGKRWSPVEDHIHWSVRRQQLWPEQMPGQENRGGWKETVLWTGEETEEAVVEAPVLKLLPEGSGSSEPAHT